MEKEEKIIKKTTEELLKMLDVDAEIILEMGEETVNITIETDDSGIIIGRHGDILESLQTILSLCISKKLDKFYRVSLEVGDYKKNREEWLLNVTADTKQRAITENREIAIPLLKAWERRVIHLNLQDDKEVVSESVGEGKDRTLVIRPKN